MILLFEIILITSLLVIGWTIITQPDMGLADIREWAEEKNSVFINATLVCHWCMSSSWSLLGYFFAWRLGLVESFSWALVWAYPLVVCGSSFLCGISWAIYKMINKITEKNDIEANYLSHIEQMAFFDLQERKKRHLEKKNNGH